MLLKELIRFSTQHRTLYCYLIMSIWIFLLIAGMYKYIGYNTVSLSNTLSYFKSKSFASKLSNEQIDLFHEFRTRCGPLEYPTNVHIGGIMEGWRLQGVLLIIRHGDRGAMSHLRAVTDIDCGIEQNALVNKYRSFLYNSSSATGANHMYWNKVGPFHGFPLLPATERNCLLGQLTYKGIAQLLHVGELLHQFYAHSLGLLLKQPANIKLAGSSSSTPNSLLNSDEVVVYTTRSRRTFQSALALLYTFLPADKWLSLNMRESHSMAFCFSDCACPQAEILRRRLNAIKKKHLQQHGAVHAILQWIGGTLLQNYNAEQSDLNEVQDALLLVLCHGAALPCRQQLTNSSTISTSTTLATVAIELNDVINIDQEQDTAAGNVAPIVRHISAQSKGQLEQQHKRQQQKQLAASNEGCVEHAHVAALMSFASVQSAFEAQHQYYHRIGLLRSYGMIRHIVSHMLKMISGDRTKFVLYSGHDWTLQFLTAALRIKLPHTFIPYAARLSFELYKSEAHTDYYFRILYNEQDVTQHVDFCEGGKSLRVTRDSRGNKADLCPIENIIRFLHEDYFAPLNATNFKDACYVMPVQKAANEF